VEVKVGPENAQKGVEGTVNEENENLQEHKKTELASRKVEVVKESRSTVKAEIEEGTSGVYKIDGHSQVGNGRTGGAIDIVSGRPPGPSSRPEESPKLQAQNSIPDDRSLGEQKEQQGDRDDADTSSSDESEDLCFGDLLARRQPVPKQAKKRKRKELPKYVASGKVSGSSDSLPPKDVERLTERQQLKMLLDQG